MKKSADYCFVLQPLTEEYAAEVCRWRYEPPHDLFNWKPWEELQANKEEFGDPDIRREQFSAVIGEDGSLCGFAQFFPLVGWTRLGLGLRPDMCGRGLGVALVTAIVQEAQRRMPDHRIDLEVLVWNSRAIHVYEKAGFVRADGYERMTPTGLDAFYSMVLPQVSGQAEVGGAPSFEGI